MIWIAIMIQWVLARAARLLSSRDRSCLVVPAARLVTGEVVTPRGTRVGKLRRLTGPGIRPWIDIACHSVATTWSEWFDSDPVSQRCLVAVRATQRLAYRQTRSVRT